MTDFAGKRALVLGLGKSGYAAALALKKRGAFVKVTDKDLSGDTLKRADELKKAGIEAEEWDDSGRKAAAYDVVAVSPGVPVDSAPVAAARKSGALVLSELELAYRLTSSPIIAITGTNGKSTVVTLLGEIFDEAGIPNIVAGNIGRPLVDCVDEAGPDTVLIVEVSSFQLETVIEFAPRIAVILNITEDHMDRHHSMGEYVSAKARIFANQTADEYAVVNDDDPLSRAAGEDIMAVAVPFSRKHRLQQGVFEFDGKVWATLPDHTGLKQIMTADRIPLKGVHNLENVLAATAVSLLWGIEPKAITRAVNAFKGLKHRVEFVVTAGEVGFYDDSKATNPDAVKRAIEAFSQPVILLAGGRNKDMDFSILIPVIKEKVKSVVLFGESAEEIGEVIAAAPETAGIPRQKAASMGEAVKAAFALAAAGDAVLLSPGCASFDMYEGYAARGDDFARQARKIACESEAKATQDAG
jgi:UDP-N-acetylmuramoylalanine--D-glutamate ligase